MATMIREGPPPREGARKKRNEAHIPIAPCGETPTLHTYRRKCGTRGRCIVNGVLHCSCCRGEGEGEVDASWTLWTRQCGGNEGETFVSFFFPSKFFGPLASEPTPRSRHNSHRSHRRLGLCALCSGWFLSTILYPPASTPLPPSPPGTVGGMSSNGVEWHIELAGPPPSLLQGMGLAPDLPSIAWSLTGPAIVGRCVAALGARQAPKRLKGEEGHRRSRRHRLPPAHRRRLLRGGARKRAPSSPLSPPILFAPLPS